MGLPEAFLVSGGLNAASSIMQGMTNAQNEDASAKEAGYNSVQERNAAKQSFAEGAMAVNSQAEKGKEAIATGSNIMSSNGNIGSSAQSQLLKSAFNLDKDLSAINYKYAGEAINHKNQAKLYDYSAKVSRKNRLSAALGSFIGAGAGATNGITNFYKEGGKF